MKKLRPWLLPLMWLLGYLMAWGSILVDRQMIIEEQRQLQETVDRARIELKIATMIDELNDDYAEQVEWNKEALEEPVKGDIHGKNN